MFIFKYSQLRLFISYTFLTLSLIYSLTITKEYKALAYTIIGVSFCSVFFFLLLELLYKSRQGNQYYVSLNLKILWSFYFVGMFLVQVTLYPNKYLLEIFLYLFFSFYIIFSLAPLFFNEEKFNELVKFLILMGTVLVFFQLLGFFTEDIFGIKLYRKDNNANFSGFAAHSGIYEHPNHLSIFLVVSILCAVWYVKKHNSNLYLIPLAILFLGLFITQSRTGILCLASVVILNIPKFFFKRAGTVLLSLVIFSILILLFSLNIEYFERYLRLSTSSAGRLGAWAFALENMEGFWLYGHGSNSPKEFTTGNEHILRQHYNSKISGAGFHNSYLNILFQYGIFPFISLILIIITALRNSFRSRIRNKQLIFDLLIVMFVGSFLTDMSIGGLRLHTTLLALIIGMSHLKLKGTNNHNSI